MATQSAVVETMAPAVPIQVQEPISFRSEAEIKALRILDEMEAERDLRELKDMGGRKCAKRQLSIYREYEVKSEGEL